MFRTVPLSIIRSFSLYTQQWFTSYRFPDSSQTVRKTVWHIPLLCVQWKTPDDGQRNCPKHVEFYSKNKFEKLVRIVGFIIRIYHDARSLERQKKWLKSTGINRTCLGPTPFWGTLADRAVIEERDLKNFAVSRFGVKYFALKFLKNKKNCPYARHFGMYWE